MPTPLTDLLTHDGFRTGAVLGLVAAAVVALVARRAGRPRPWAGLAFGVAVVVGVAERSGVEAGTVAGLVLLAAGGHLAARRPTVVRVGAALPGAAIFTWAAAPESPSWAVPTILAVTLVGGALLARFDEAFAPSGLPPVLLAVTTAGIYATTPDTEHAAILLGAAVPVALLGRPRPLASLGAAGSFVVAALMSWDVVVEGSGRDGAVVGGLACLGVLALEPLVRQACAPRSRGTVRDADAGVTVTQAILVVALHVAVVIVSSRVAGLRDSAVEALAICAIAYAGAAALLAWRPLQVTADRPAVEGSGARDR
jgi:hypothetical protein